MSRFEVDSVQVGAAAGAVTGSVASITAEVDRMMRNLLELQGSWKGQAAGQFQVVVEDWRATQERVKASLEQISSALAVAATNYADVEQSNARMFMR
jgi:WXG100 family type VII secretion target